MSAATSLTLDPSSRHVSVDRLTADLLRSAAEADGADQFLEDVAEVLFRGHSPEGVSIRAGDNPSKTDLVAAIGDVRRLERTIKSGDSQATSGRTGEPLPAPPTVELRLGSRCVVISLSFPQDPDADVLDGARLRQILTPSFSLFDTIHAAREDSTLSSALIREGTDAIIGLTTDGVCRLWNPAAERLFGWPEDDVLGRPLPIIPGEDRSAWMELIGSADASGCSGRDRLSARRWDGTMASVEARVIPVCSGNSSLPQLLLCVRDQTAERRAEDWQRLIGAAAERAIAPIAPQGIVEVLKLVSDTGCYRQAELWRRDSKTDKWEPWSSADGRRTAPGETVRRQLDAAASGRFLEPVTITHMRTVTVGRPLHPSASLIAVPLATGVVLLLEQDDLQVGRVAEESLRTLTAVLATAVRRQLEAEDFLAMQQRIARTERLEALGLLTTSVAHDLNNVLSIIFGYCDLAGQNNASADCVEQILLAAEKGARIVRQLLSSGRTSRQDLATFEVSEALAELKPLLTSLTGPTISLVIDRPTQQTFPVRMPRTDFDQVILNLVANARDAMPDGGTLCCVLDRCEPELRDLKLNPSLHPGPCVRLRVIDAGCGMTEETRRRIFEPFFTTKAGDRGTGLGLSTVRQIVDRAAGGITVASAPGKGTAVSVMLPRALSELSPRMVDIPAQIDPRGSESILIVCDDARMRELLARLLQVRGYRVSGLSSLAEIESHQRQSPGKFDLLLAEGAIIDRWAGSGSSFKGNLPPRLLRIADVDVPAGQTGAGFGFVQTLVKPFTSQQLAIAVREALGDSVRRPAAEVTV